MKTITTHCGAQVIVDDVDYEFLSKVKWHLSNGYPRSTKLGKMYRWLLKPKPHEMVDHIDRNKLNNTRSNLRIVDAQINSHNRKRRSTARNLYQGVLPKHGSNVWETRTTVNGECFCIGVFKTPLAAAIAYNRKVRSLSKYMQLNEIKLSEKEQDEILERDSIKLKAAEHRSKYKGVYWFKKRGRMKCGKWSAIARVNGKQISLGLFMSEYDAAKMVAAFHKLPYPQIRELPHGVRSKSKIK